MKRLILLLVLLTGLMLLAACGGSAPSADPEAAAPAAAPAEAAATEATDQESVTNEPADGMRNFAIVPGESAAMYMVDEEFFGGALDKYGIAAGDYDIVGRTENIEGELRLDLANAAIGPSEFRVNVSTLTTDQNRRDRWIRENGPRFLDFPEAVFVATSVEGAPEGYVEGEQTDFTLNGDMTIREITQPMTFDVTATLDGDTITGTAAATALLTDFGIDPPDFANTLTVANEFRIQVDFVAREQ